MLIILYVSASMWSHLNKCLFGIENWLVKFIHSYLFLIKPKGVHMHIFGFAEIIPGFAILLVLYTMTDIRYRFRVSISPIPTKLIFYILSFVAIFSLFSDFWYAETWPVPVFLSDPLILQFIFGLLFLIPILVWIYYAFINPPIFNKWNAKKFYDRLYTIIVCGLEQELPVIANELGRSACSIVECSCLLPDEFQSTNNTDNNKKRISVGDYAHDLLLLIANRKFCQYIAASTPITAIIFFLEMTKQRKYQLPISRFGVNVFTEVLINTDSILYHEGPYESDVIGRDKPFSQSLFSDYTLIETLATQAKSPFDVSHKLVSSWNANQLEAYCNCLIISFNSYLHQISIIHRMQSFYALARGLEIIGDSCGDLYKINDSFEDYYNAEPYKRLITSVGFIRKLFDLLEAHKNLPKVPLCNKNRNNDIYDHICEQIFEIIFSASSISKPVARCWMTQYGAVFCHCFGGLRDRDSDIINIIRFRLRRMLFDEIMQLDKFPNFKSARILGFCLNVMGVSLRKKAEGSLNQHYYALHKVILHWVRNNYLKILNYNREIAEACLMGGVTYDSTNKRLVRTYTKELNGVEPKEYLDLND